MGRSSRWLIFLPVALFALFAPQPAEASQVGLLVRGYQIDEIPPTMSDVAYPLCGTSVEPFINATWDWQPYEECGEDSFMLHYTGFIQIPEHETIEFWIASDDGGTVKIGTEEFGVWQDQGCSATTTGQLQIEAGTWDLDAWFYENGGGTCFMLAWNIDNTGWEIIQPEFFTSEPLTIETTSTLEVTTTESTTTTTELSTTTFQPTTTEAPQTTTALPQTTSSVIPPPDPLPIPVVVATTSAPATTTTLEPLPETTLTTYPQTTEPLPPSTTAPIIPSDTSTSLPKPSETSTSVEVTPPTFFSPDEPLTTEQFVSVLAVLSESSPDEVAEIVDQILASDLTSSQAEQLVSAGEILTAINSEQAKELFQEIEPTQLSESMAAVIADALNDPEVPDEVREAFEESINIFNNDGSPSVPLSSPS